MLSIETLHDCLNFCFAARLRNPQDGLFTGQIDAVDTLNCSYRVTFDRPGKLSHAAR